jgi:hypothetical protein
MLETDDGEVGEDEDDGGDVSASCADLAFCSATAKNEQPLRDVVWTVEVGARTERGSFVNAQGLRIVHWTWPASESTCGIVVAVHGIEVGRCIGPGWCGATWDLAMIFWQRLAVIRIVLRSPTA